MSDQSLIVKPTEAIENGSLIKLIQDTVPKLQGAVQKTLENTKKYETVTEENLEDVKALIVPVRTTKEKMETLRQSVTRQMDALKEFMMIPEKEVKAEEERLRAGVAKVEQEKIKRNAAQQAEAEKIKRRDQTKADIIAKIKINVTDVIINRCRTVDGESQKFFNEIADIATFDKKAATYKGAKWRMKPEEYESCFVVPYDQSAITKEEVKVLVDALKEDMTYEKVNAMYLEKAGPIFNNWISKIPQLREEWVNKFKAGEEERKRLDEESKRKQEEESKRQEEYLKEQQDNMKVAVETEQKLANIEADFREQGTVQELEKTGPKKKVIKFTTDKPVAELAEIIYHCFMHPKFKGILKLDKDKKPILDDQGRKEYVDAVNYFLDFFASNCDADVKNTQVFLDARVIIRK